MALTIVTNFNGDVAAGIYKDFAVGNEVVSGNKFSGDRGIAYLELDVPDKRELRNATQTTRPFGEWKETPVTGDITVSTAIGKRELNLEKVMIYEEFKPEDYDLEWPDVRSIGSQTEHMLSPALMLEVLSLLVPNAGAHISELFFEGDKAGSGGLEFIDGIIVKAVADGSTVQVTPAGVITSANVINILTDVIDAIPSKDYINDAYKILVSMEDFRILQRANTDAKKTSDGVLDDNMKNLLEEKTIIPFVGLAKNHIIATKVGESAESNLHLGFWFDETREMQDLRVDRVAPNSENWFLRLNLKLDANYKLSENLIYYVPA